MTHLTLEAQTFLDKEGQALDFQISLVKEDSPVKVVSLDKAVSLVKADSLVKDLEAAADHLLAHQLDRHHLSFRNKQAERKHLQ